jgi:hypothetical protein
MQTEIEYKQPSGIMPKIIPYLIRICSTSSLPIVEGMLLCFGGSGAFLFLPPPGGSGAGRFGCRGMLDSEEYVAPILDDLLVERFFSFR